MSQVKKRQNLLTGVGGGAHIVVCHAVWKHVAAILLVVPS